MIAIGATKIVVKVLLFLYKVVILLAEYNKQRFYWIKLTDRFMTSDTVDFLMEQKDGANYVVIYQMLCLKTVNNDGCLSRSIGEMIIPYDEEKIQRDLKWFSIDTIRVAMNLYKRLGLIYEQDDGVLRITDFDNLVGSQSISAEKKQIQRAKTSQNQIENKGGQKGGQMSTRERYRDKEKDIKREDKDIYKECVDNNIYNTYGEAEIPFTGNPSTATHTPTYGLEEFLQDNPQIRVDNYNGIIDDMNFAELTRRIRESSWLQQVEDFSFFCLKYNKIISGGYKDIEKKEKADKPQGQKREEEKPKRKWEYECTRC